MTRLTGARPRRGFTLIELLVVMALIAALAAMVMVIAPGALERDRSVAAVAQLEGAFQISRARALRDGLPRGVRLIRSGGGPATEYQFIESPPVFVPNPGGPSGDSPYTPATPPYVEFVYNTNATGHVAPGANNNPPARACRIIGLAAEHRTQIQSDISGGRRPLLTLPTLGGWYTLTASTFTAATNTLTVTLLSYPDSLLGATTRWRTYHFGVYGSARTLLGEATLQLPQNTAVDLARSSPGGGAGDYDILFAPSGQLVTTPSTQGAGHVFLWVRDPARPATFQQGGEQLIVVIKARSGAIGSAPVDWTPGRPFDLARRAISGQ